MKIIPTASKTQVIYKQRPAKKNGTPVKKNPSRYPIPNFLKSFTWFGVGVFLGIFILVSSIFIYFRKGYEHVVYPGVMVGGMNFGGKTQDEVKKYFDQKNAKIGNTKFVFTLKDDIATISAQQLQFGYDAQLLSDQAFAIGRSKDPISNISLVVQAYVQGINLPPAYQYSEKALKTLLQEIIQKNYVAPVDALFSFENERVTAFGLSSDGQEVNIQDLKKRIEAKTLSVVKAKSPQTVIIPIPIRVLKPKVLSSEVNKLGITEQIASGTSFFRGSIPSRIFNITLAASKVNGLLVAPGETFSFDKALGDVSSFTGFKQAYVIQNGRTVLGDGGGVCQVSTTLFRALLNAGLPIVERNAHAYRVGYYEQDAPPGLDATIYVPTVDLKFKNDTANHILIQNYVDQNTQQITYYLYGTKDGREVTMTKPVISSQTPPPEPLYQDDPTLPKGEVKQVDFAAAGASVYFTREVKKDNKVIIADKFVSNFRPWQAVYLRGTKE